MKEQLVDTFREDFRIAYDLCRDEYTDSFTENVQIMEDHVDRVRESSSNLSESEPPENSKTANDS